MPAGDRTGPQGQGPGTGRKMGFCFRNETRINGSGSSMDGSISSMDGSISSVDNSRSAIGLFFGFGRGRGHGSNRRGAAAPQRNSMGRGIGRSFNT